MAARRWLGPSVSLLLVLAVWGCGGGASAAPPEGAAPPAPANGPTGAKLFEILTVTDPFQQWGQFPLAPGTTRSSPPHAALTTVRVNQVALDAVGSGATEFPDGSIIVKQGTNGDGVSGEVWVVMWKVRGFDPDNHDWFWANLLPDGTVNAKGKVFGCTNCHGAVRDHDFVFLQPL